jgi:hypothetical protein
MWKRAISELIEGRDGKIRTAVIRNPEGNKLTRPIQLVIPLEVDQCGEDVEEYVSPNISEMLRVGGRIFYVSSLEK